MKTRYFITPAIAFGLLCVFCCCLAIPESRAQFSGTGLLLHERGGLLINEISNGPSGPLSLKEYIELVVYGAPANPGAGVDLRGWIIDDNNFPASGQGNAPGHIVFGECYSAVPPGSILVIYNADDRNALLPPDDPQDTNPRNGVYIIPHNHPCLNACFSNPNFTTPLYCPCLSPGSAPLGWALNMRNSGDVLQIRDPCESVVQAFAWGGVQLSDDLRRAPGLFDLGAVEQGAKTLRLTNSRSDNWFDLANYDNVSILGNESPGAPNSTANADLIRRLANTLPAVEGRIYDCRDTDAGDLLLPRERSGSPVPLQLCLGEDLSAFARDYSRPDEFEPDAVGFNFEYTFLLTANDAPVYTVLDHRSDGDFDFSRLPAGTYAVWGFSYIQTNGSVTLADFLSREARSIAEIQAYEACGFDGDIDNRTLDDQPLLVVIEERPGELRPFAPPPVCADSTGAYVFNLSSFSGQLISREGDSLIWFSDDKGTQPINRPEAFQTISVTVYAAAARGGCRSALLPIPLLVNPSPTLVLEKVSGISCFGANDGEIILSGRGGAEPYSLSINDRPPAVLPASRQQLTGLSPGDVALRLFNQAGCFSEKIATITDAPERTLELGPDTTITQGQSVSIQGIADFDPTFLLWTPTDYLQRQGGLNAVSTPPRTTTYVLAAFDERGCAATDTLTIFVTPTLNVFAPNAFSPDNDGRNDRFVLYTGLEEVRIRRLLIFDRWGDLVFQRLDFLPNDESLGWDGSYKGQPMPIGLYVYLAEIESPVLGKQLKKGEILLVR